jgi:hypothetical protein
LCGTFWVTQIIAVTQKVCCKSWREERVDAAGPLTLPPWDFGKLLGLCVVFFFIFAQVTSWLVFKQIPSVTVLIGGSLIIAGGVVISLAKA